MPEETKKENTSGKEDASLRMLNARRMIELRKRANTAAKAQEESQAPKPPSDREIVLGALRERGDEVLRSAEASYPREMSILIPRLASLVRTKQVTTITGGDLLQFLRSIGFRVSVRTSITVTQHGKSVSLADKLKQDQG